MTRVSRGAVLHSAEGTLGGAFHELEGPAEKSWDFTIGLDGTLFQHYDTDRETWHAGEAGIPYVGIEHENEYSAGAPNHNPITDAQVRTIVRLLRWLALTDGWAGFTRGVELWEHHELAGNSTTCPNGRIRWSDILKELNMPNPDARNVIMALVSAGEFVRRAWNLGDLGDEDKAAIRWVAQHIEDPRTVGIAANTGVQSETS